MCGITGIYNFTNESRITEDILQPMMNIISHRGPDDAGFHIDSKIGLGFRRLSIIDLNTGNQPIFNEDRNLALVCNGEIFNYKELRNSLIQKNHKFYTTTDVEVLVHLYEEYGVQMVSRLNGQFAFVIYDKKNNTLFAARDHIGIAPFFWTLKNGVFIFASEIKSILKYPGIDKTINATALDQMLTFPGLVSPQTMFKKINSLKAGHYIFLKDGNIQITEYWDLKFPQENARRTDIRSEEFYSTKIDEILREAVRLRLQADVPVGFYLSGGLDSSYIAALISVLHPNNKFHSFSISFTDRDIDERKYQDIMSAKVNSMHNRIEFDRVDVIDRLKTAVYHAETPLKESYDTCSLALSGLVKKNGIKVVLRARMKFLPVMSVTGLTQLGRPAFTMNTMLKL